MKDRRSVNGLSIEELERVLLIKRREARLARLRQIDPPAQVVGRDPLEAEPSWAHNQSQVAVAADDTQQQSLWSRLMEWLAEPQHVNWRFVFNGILLMIELAAVAGLTVITVGAWRDRERIDKEAAEIVVLPTTTPTSESQATATSPAELIKAVVLPGGHVPPNAQGFSQPEPIPEQLQELARTITPQPLPTRGPGHAVRVVIPSIGVDHPVVEGDDWETLKRGVGHTPWSANPGEVGNCVLSAHNDIFGEIFRRLPEAELDDEILVYTGAQVYRYVVKATHIVEPTQVELLDGTERRVLTLITSYPYLVDDQRIVVIAELEP